MNTGRIRFVFALAAAAFPLVGFSAPETPSVVKNPPRTWIDPETGHRVIRITDEPNTESLYFNDNCFTPDGKEMIFTTNDGGISVLDVATWRNRPVVKGRVRVIMVGHKTPRVFYLKPEDNGLYATNLDTGETQKLAALPARGGVSAINADETLAAGTRVLDENSGHQFVTGKGTRYRPAWFSSSSCEETLGEALANATPSHTVLLFGVAGL